MGLKDMINVTHAVIKTNKDSFIKEDSYNKKDTTYNIVEKINIFLKRTIIFRL